MFRRPSPLLLLAALLPASTVVAQIPSGVRSVNGPRPGAPLVLVATPHTVNADDSAMAVAIGVGLRERLRRQVGRDYAIATRDRMNESLSSFGYPADALLDQLAARTLAVRSSSSMMVFSHLTRADGGHRLTTRFVRVGQSYGAGHLVALTRTPGEDPEDLGQRAADAIRPAFRAMDAAMECYNNAATDQAKAIAGANRALTLIPNFGAAEFCLGELAVARDSVSLAALGHYENAVRSDPQSMPSYRAIQRIHHYRGDSAKVVATWQTMLEVDPLDQELREQAFTLFQAYGRPSAAEEVADAGIRRDPQNTDWYDLKSNACLVQEKLQCAIDELERMFTIDSTRADTNFYSKITYATRFANDTARFVKWAAKGIEKYPDHVDLLKEAAQAYAMSGNVESSVTVVKKLLTINPDDTDPLRTLAVMLGQAGQPERVIEFIPIVTASGDTELSDVFGNILVNGAQAARTASDTARQLVLAEAAATTGMTNPQLVSYAGFFAGEVLYNQIAAQMQAVRDARSCPRVGEYEALVNRALPHLRSAMGATQDAIRNFAAQLVPYLEREQTAIGQMRAQYCN